MDALNKLLGPIIEMLPEGWRLQGGLIVGGLALVVGVVGLALLFRLGRTLFGKRPPQSQDEEQALTEDLATYPPLAREPGGHVLTVFHVPARLRLVVVASAGRDGGVEAGQIAAYLDRLVPGLGDVATHDRPRLRLWPAQISHHGFASTFFRRTRIPEKLGLPSPWVLVAGRTQVGRQTVLLGLALWADRPNTLGRLEMEPHQWVDILRLQTLKG